MSASIKYDTVGYHFNCPDGACAAAIVKRHSPNVQTIGLNVGPKGTMFKYESSFVNKRVIYVDLCPSLEYLLLLSKKCKSVTVLDHHFGTPQYDEIDAYLKEGNTLPPNVTIVLNKEKCGATIAWTYLFPNDDIPDFVMYVEDQDLWTRELPDTSEINTAIASDYLSVEGMAKLFDVPINVLYERGVELWKMQTMVIEDAIKKRTTEHYHMHEGKRLRCYINSGPYQYRSHIGDRLMDVPMKDGKPPDFVVIYCHVLRTHTFLFSLRGREGRMSGVTCADICKKYNGGGHVSAACFERDATEDPKLIFPPL